MTVYNYPEPCAPQYKKPTSVKACLPQARLFAKKEHGRAAMGPVQKGDQILIVTLPDQDKYLIRFIDKVQVKGREIPILVYEIFNADPEPVIEKKLKTRADFEEGQRCYFTYEFADAIKYFEKVLAIHPADPSAQLYLERSELFLKKGVPEGWQGIERRTSK